MKSEILQGDALSVLKTMPDESVQCCVTSPPYYGLRNYGVEDQIGLESTPQEYVARLVAVFREVRRVLTDDGVLFLNLGDSYWTDSPVRRSAIEVFSSTWDVSQTRSNGGLRKSAAKSGVFKNKDLIGIPWRVAFALQEDGWYLRQDIIWEKPNPMPESVTDRCTKSHEYIFLMTKSARYYYNNEAIKEPLADASIARLMQDVESQKGSDRVPGKTNGTMKAVGKGYDASTLRHKNVQDKGLRPHSMHLSRVEGVSDADYFGEVLTRNKRSVWTVATQPFKESHFATFPTKLIEPMILAGSKPGDTVLDPFNGAGTTGLVALRHSRNYIGIELNPEYIAISERRLKEISVKLF